MTPSLGHQRAATRLLLQVTAPAGFVLAGSGAIREHGIIERPTMDIDLFTDREPDQQFVDAIDTAIDALRSAGFDVVERRRTSGFASLVLSTADGYEFKADFGWDHRAHDPTLLEIGPVLDVADAVGNKVAALYSRQEARDYLDLDAILRTGRFSDAQLIQAARERDGGFDLPQFLRELRQVARIRPDDVVAYGYDTLDLAGVRSRLLAWADRLDADIA